MASEELVSVSVRIPKTLKERFEKIAEANYRSLAAQLLLVIDQYLSDQDAAAAKAARKQREQIPA